MQLAQIVLRNTENQMSNEKYNHFIVIWCQGMLHELWILISVLSYCKTKCGTNYI
jgi:hypothetical protein